MTQYIVNPHTNRIAYFYTTLETYLNESLSPDYKVKDAILNFFYFEKLMCWNTNSILNLNLNCGILRLIKGIVNYIVYCRFPVFLLI